MNRAQRRRQGNKPCWCGSGNKLKNCHKEPPPMVPHNPLVPEAREALRQKLHGKGKPIVSTVWKGQRFVAAGSTLFYSTDEKTKTFSDFLNNYIKMKFKSDWGNAEIKKPLAHRHPILQWYDQICRIQEAAQKDENGLYQSELYGVIRCYYNLAYNLFLLQNNVEVQELLLKRLKNSVSFYPAYYETYVAAWFILAGFKLELENERDGSTTHCEFTATAPSGRQFSVEAKSRAAGKDNLDVGNQLYKALKKDAKFERIVFIDLNVTGIGENDLLYVKDSIRNREPGLMINGNDAPPAYVVVTNQPFHLHLSESNIPMGAMAEGFKIPDFGNKIPAPSLTDAYKASQKHKNVELVLDAIKNYQIPSTFDGELPEFTFGDAERRFFIDQEYELQPGVMGKLTHGIVMEEQKEAVLMFSNGSQTFSLREPLSDAEISAYRQDPDTFFGKFEPVSKGVNTPLELYEFFLNGYKDTPRKKLLEFMKLDEDQVANVTDEELRYRYAEGLTHSTWKLGDENREESHEK